MTSASTRSCARGRNSGFPTRGLRLLADLFYKLFVALLLYGFFTPVAFWLRLIRRDALKLRLDRGATSYWIKRRPPGPKPSSMANLY